MDKSEARKSRRNFLKLGLGAGAASLAGFAGARIAGTDKPAEEASAKETIKVLTPDGKLVEVEKSSIVPPKDIFIDRKEAHKGIPGRKFVMVIDLAKCKNARKCIDACQ